MQENLGRRFDRARGEFGKEERAGIPGQEVPTGPGPAPSWSQGPLPAAALEQPEGGGGEGCLKTVEFPKEKQRLYSANSEAADTQPEDWGLCRRKGRRRRKRSHGLGRVSMSEVPGC